MTNLELEMEYMALKLAGKLRGAIGPLIHGHMLIVDMSWVPEEECMEEEVNLGMEFDKSLLIDMPWEEFKVQNHLRFLFDLN